MCFTNCPLSRFYRQKHSSITQFYHTYSTTQFYHSVLPHSSTSQFYYTVLPHISTSTGSTTIIKTDICCYGRVSFDFFEINIKIMHFKVVVIEFDWYGTTGLHIDSFISTHFIQADRYPLQILYSCRLLFWFNAPIQKTLVCL